MSTNLQNSIWPNTDGNLGNIKVQIPDGVTTTWPTGDALVGNFVFNKGKLVGLVDTKALIANDSKTTTFPYDYVNIKVDKSLEGVMTFNGCAKPEYLNVTYTESANSGDTVTFKYKGCKTVDDIKAVDPDYLTNDIVNGVWSERLDDLEQGGNGQQDGGMFSWCDNLTTFSSDLPNLTDGNRMFNCCHNLTTFSSDLPNLTNGDGMFNGCPLTSFSAKLPKLEYGGGMFNGCLLDTASVQHIADTINTAPSSKVPLYIGIGNSTPNEEEKAAFNKMVSKGWFVNVTTNGSIPGLPWNPTSLTPIDGEEQQTPIPYWAKPVPSDKKYARYTDSEGNFYNILGGNFIYGDSLETYGMFTCEEDAAAQMGLTKIEK